MKSFGEYIRELRTGNDLLLRQVAAQLDIDPSLLSRIERGEKQPTRDQVLRLARILNADEAALLATYLSERVVYELKGEKLALRAIQLAEKRITYEKNRSKRSK